jgi:hypothetical protein
VKRRLFFGALLALAVTTAGTLSQFGFGGSEKARIANSSVSALKRTARAGDTLPSSVLAYPFAARNFASPNGGGSRLVLVQDPLRLYAVPGKGGLLCLIEVDSLAETAGGSCADRNLLRTGSIYMADRQEDGSRLVVGLAGDGATFAQADGKRTGIENNAFVLQHVGGSDFTVGSPAASQTIDIED